MKVCPDCDEEIENEELDWAPGTQGSGALPGVCMECARYYWAKEDQFEDEFESSLQSNSGIDLEDGDVDS